MEIQYEVVKEIRMSQLHPKSMAKKQMEGKCVNLL